MVSESKVRKTEAPRVFHPKSMGLPLNAHASYVTLFPSPKTSASNLDGQAIIYGIITGKGSSCQFQELAPRRQNDLPIVYAPVKDFPFSTSFHL